MPGQHRRELSDGYQGSPGCDPHEQIPDQERGGYDQRSADPLEHRPGSRADEPLDVSTNLRIERLHRDHQERARDSRDDQYRSRRREAKPERVYRTELPEAIGVIASRACAARPGSLSRASVPVGF